VELKPGKYTLGMEFEKTDTGSHGESLGEAKLYVDDTVVASGKMRTQAGKFTLSGDGLCVGYDSGDAVSSLYKSPGKFTGGTIQGVGVSVKGEPYKNLEAEAKRMMMKQ
jgi:arylsulfatase